jgi:hypothetical protein
MLTVCVTNLGGTGTCDLLAENSEKKENISTNATANLINKFGFRKNVGHSR